VKQWKKKLEGHSTAFVEHANALATWDRHIVNNRSLLLKLNEELKKAAAGQERLEREVNIIEVRQKEVSKALTDMELEVERLYGNALPAATTTQAPLSVASAVGGDSASKTLFSPGGSADLRMREKGISGAETAGQEREWMYKQAEDVSKQLNNIGSTLRETIEKLNSSHSLERDNTSNPLAVVGRILNNQLNSLLWIDQQVEQVEAQMNAIATMRSKIQGG